MIDSVSEQPAEVDRDRPVFRLLSDEKADRIHRACLDVLAKTGVRISHQQVCDRLLQAGCRAGSGSDIVRIPHRLVDQAIESCPNRFTVHDRTGEEAMDVGGRRSYYGMGTTCLYYYDHLTGKRRDAAPEDLALAARVCDALPNIDFAAPPLVVRGTARIPTEMATQAGFAALLSQTTKPIIILGEKAPVLKDCLDMAAAIAGGMEVLRNKPFVYLIPSIISPLVFDADTCARFVLAAETGIPVRCGSSALAGGTGPVTTAGMVTLSLAECLAGLVISQVLSPGLPAVIGCTTGMMDMKTGNLTYSSPEANLASMAITEMAHYHDLPVVGPAAFSSSHEVDMQASLELMLFIYNCALTGSNQIAHLGGMEAGKGFSLLSLVLADEIIGLVKRMIRGMEVDDEALALEAIDEVGQGGQYMTSRHTFRNFRQEVWNPGLLNRDVLEVWRKKGGKSIEERIRVRLDEIIETHEPEPLSAEANEEVSNILKRIVTT